MGHICDFSVGQETPRDSHHDVTLISQQSHNVPNFTRERRSDRYHVASTQG